MRHHGSVNAAIHPATPADQGQFTDTVFLDWANAFVEWANGTILAIVSGTMSSLLKRTTRGWLRVGDGLMGLRKEQQGPPLEVVGPEDRHDGLELVDLSKLASTLVAAFELLVS